MISYAQNFEDVILWRALRHIERGFYIDVGAQDPIVDSVSLAFYEHGWRGVHVEPSMYYADKLRDARPDEEVIQNAIGTEAGNMVFWEFPDTGLSTGIPAIAEKHQREGRGGREVTVTCIPLSKVLDCYRGDIHWLKIDVEGMERPVIESWSPSPVRPWVVIVESTKPNSQEPSFAEWEPSLVGLGYEFVYFDGINRFYVSLDHSELKASFGPGPNWFDGFMLNESAPYCQMINAKFQARTAAKDEELRRLNSLIRLLQSELNQLQAQAEAAAEVVHQLTEQRSLLQNELGRLQSVIDHQNEWGEAATEQVRQLTERLSIIRSSLSWRITAPLRECARVASRIGARVARRSTTAPSVEECRSKRRTSADALPSLDAIFTDAIKDWRLGKRLDA